MSIYWLMIFVTPVTFILVESDPLLINYVDNKGYVSDGVNHQNGSIKSVSTPSSDFGKSTKLQEIPNHWIHQKMIIRQRKIEEEKKKYQHLIAALSKIARIQSSYESPAITRQNLISRIGSSIQRESESLQNGTVVKKIGRQPLFDTSGSFIRKRNVHCQVIQDVYIPDIKESIPSYLCKFGSKNFILASKRFFQDYKNSLDINVDEKTIRKLTNSSINSKNSSRFNIIPAILALKQGHENYDIHDQQDIAQIFYNKSID